MVQVMYGIRMFEKEQAGGRGMTRLRATARQAKSECQMTNDHDSRSERLLWASNLWRAWEATPRVTKLEREHDRLSSSRLAKTPARDLWEFGVSGVPPETQLPVGEFRQVPLSSSKFH
jgi:hypothetical protein